MTIAVDKLIQTIQQLSQPDQEYVVASLLNSEQPEVGRAYIVRDEQLLGGEPLIYGTKTPVRAIVEMWRIGTAPEEIPEHLPHLSLSQVFHALSYYADHQSEINHYIELNRVPEDKIHPAVKAAISSS